MNEFWNIRYFENDFAYGKEPNAFFKSVLEGLTPGRLLLPGEGEGRNAVFAASLGWEVEAFDFSGAAQKKALQLAAENKVTIDYAISDFTGFEPEPETYDAAALIYIHQPEELREQIHLKIIKSLKPGGTLIIEAFDKDQLKYNSGGPKDEAMLASLEEVYTDFHNFEIDHFSKELINLSEGKYHKGEASVIRFVGKKHSP